MRVSAVIGSNFGDEGKGLVTDYLSTKDTLVVRFNGGAQAGHTVVTPSGRRHVFHHFGSGSFHGAATFLSEDFIVNPMEFVREYHELEALGVRPQVYVDPAARVTTPWDMLVNQYVESNRGKNRHGSCGLGIHETVMRSRVPEMSLYYQDLIQALDVRSKVERIWGEWSPERVRSLGFSVWDFDSWTKRFDDTGILVHFMQDIVFLVEHSQMVAWGSDPSPKAEFDQIIFEGAQGLRLDQDAEGFPHVTCSKTGLANVAKLMKKAESTDEVKVWYVTRPYITRHGAGQLSHELLPSNPPREFAMQEKTNITNQWQGVFRYGHFDMDEFLKPVLKDFYDTKLNAVPKIALTCVDHSKTVPWLLGGKSETSTPREFADELLRHTEFEAIWVSQGPTRTTFTPWG